MKKLLILFAALSLVACEKDNEISQADLNALNARLVGAWRELPKNSTNPNARRYLTFSADFKRSVYTSTEKWENRDTDREAEVDSLPYRLEKGKIFYHDAGAYFNYMVDDNTLIIDHGPPHADFVPGDTKFVSSYERIKIEGE
jgi:hypothetical protein